MYIIIYQYYISIHLLIIIIVYHLQAGPGARASLPQTLKASVLTATPEVNDRRKVVIAYDGFDIGRQMLTWAAKFCLAAGDELFLLQYQVS